MFGEPLRFCDKTDAVAKHWIRVGRNAHEYGIPGAQIMEGDVKPVHHGATGAVAITIRALRFATELIFWGVVDVGRDDTPTVVPFGDCLADEGNCVPTLVQADSQGGSWWEAEFGDLFPLVSHHVYNQAVALAYTHFSLDATAYLHSNLAELSALIVVPSFVLAVPLGPERVFENLVRQRLSF